LIDEKTGNSRRKEFIQHGYWRGHAIEENSEWREVLK
jgi:hypothetical protein